jgi:hypothetical protein
MKMFKFLGATLAAALLVAGCGGSGNTLTQGPSTGSGGGGTATPTKLTVSTDSAAILADGTTTAKITALALDANNVLLPGVVVTFQATSGGVAVTQGTTDTSGAAIATLSSGGDPTLRTITVTAIAGSLSATVAVQVVGNGSSSPVAAITVTTDTPTILSDGSEVANITALVRDASNNLIPNVPVVFTASSGGISATNSTTDATGAAKAVLSTAGDPTLRTITVTTKASTISATVMVQVVAGSGSVSVQMGSGIGAAFTVGTIAVSNPSLSAGGSTSLQVVLQQSDGTLYTQSSTIAFSSPCAAQNFATLTPSVTTTTGIATANYTSTGCNGADTITATATIGGRSLSATGSVTVQAAAIGSIRFVSATPTIIALKGLGSTALPESSTVIFKVLDAGGNPRPGATVNFSLNTAVGGVALLNTTANSQADGSVQTIVQSGTVATPVRVTAVVQGVSPVISTQSSALTISTGIPQQASFSLAVGCHNIEAWSLDGVQVPVTARLSDRFNNPVPDGTAVSFFTEGGQIAAQCTTTTTSGNSSCTVNWTSQNPRPPKDAALPLCTTLPVVAGTCDRPGRSSLLSVAIGEESFTDVNGNGSFDPGEPFIDMGERFVDANENGTYDVGEVFYDFNNDHVHNGPDGFFNGVLCNDPARCNQSALTTGIGAQNLIIMSDGVPTNLLPAPGTTFHVAAGGSSVVAFTFADLNNNPLPAGTTIAATMTGAGLAVGAPSTFTVPCTTEPTTYGFVITESNPPATTSGLLTLTVTSPGGGGSKGITTTVQYPIVVP